MDYAKLQLIQTRSLPWRKASAQARGAAISILAYCADVENSGTIPGAKLFPPEDWLLMLAISPADVQAAIASGLCEWNGIDLICRLYDHEGHASLMVKRAQGHHGVKGGRPNNPSNNPKGSHAETHRGTLPITPSPVQSSPSRPVQAMDGPGNGSSRDQPSGADPLDRRERSEEEKNQRVRDTVARLGGSLENNGQDLTPEWREAFRGKSKGEIETVFVQASPRIVTPHDFLARLDPENLFFNTDPDKDKRPIDLEAWKKKML